jgi:hypothetical protein
MGFVDTEKGSNEAEMKGAGTGHECLSRGSLISTSIFK